MLDEQVVALSKAIRQHETGNRAIGGATGEMVSRYQFLPATWQAEAGRILGDQNALLTLENENRVAYTRIKEWKDQGMNPGQIASMWNSGQPDMYAVGDRGVGQSSADPTVTFNVPAYVNSVYNLYNQYKPAPFQELSPAEQLDIQSAEQFKPTFGETQVLPQFAAETEEKTKFFPSIVKTIANIPASLWNLGKGIVHFLNPKTAATSAQQLGTDIGTFIEEVKQGEPMPSFIDVLKEVPGAAKETLLPQIIQDWVEVGSAALRGQDAELDKAIDNAYRTSVNDPLNIAPAIFILRGVAGKAGVGEQFDAGVSKVARPVIETFKKTKEGIASATKKSAEFTAAQVTGLKPETISEVIFKPESFTRAEMAKMDRGTLAERVKKAFDLRLRDLSETGREYNEIRRSSAIAEVDPIRISKVFDKYGIKFDKDGKIIRTAETPPLKPGDITAFEDFQRIFGNEKYLSSNAFLNARATLSEMAKFDMTKTALPQKVSKDLRKVYDATGKRQIPGLRELDAKYAPEVKMIQQLKKDYFKPDGTLKDGALNKIANLTGKGRDIVLKRLEKLIPGIVEDIRILKAVEDIQATKGQKFGTYMRAGITGGLLATGNPIIAAVQLLLSQPAVVVPLLRAFGKANGIKVSIINAIISKLKAGVKLTAKELEILNMSVDDVVKKISKMKAGLSIEEVPDAKAAALPKTTSSEIVKNESINWLQEWVGTDFGGRQSNPSQSVIDFFNNSKYRPTSKIKVYRAIDADMTNIEILKLEKEFYQSWTKSKAFANRFGKEELGDFRIIEKIVNPDEVFIDINKLPHSIKQKTTEFFDIGGGEREVILKAKKK